jgi:hypothetical protein
MALIYPSHIKVGHWKGALKASLVRAPLEQFLSTAKLKIAYGPSRDSDNLTRAAVFMIDRGLQVYFHGRDEGLAESQYGVVGRLACMVSRRLAELIQQPNNWRIPALLGTAQLLTPWIGLNAAARESADSTQEFTVSLENFNASAEEREIAELISAAVKNDDNASLETLAQAFAAQLDCPSHRMRAAAHVLLPRTLAAP